jgi:hypothetical protein
MLKFIFKHLHRATCSHLSKRYILKQEKNIYNVYDVQCLECGKLLYQNISQIQYDKYYMAFTKIKGKKVIV